MSFRALRARRPVSGSHQIAAPRRSPEGYRSHLRSGAEFRASGRGPQRRCNLYATSIRHCDASQRLAEPVGCEFGRRLNFGLVRIKRHVRGVRQHVQLFARARDRVEGSDFEVPKRPTTPANGASSFGACPTAWVATRCSTDSDRRRADPRRSLWPRLLAHRSLARDVVCVAEVRHRTDRLYRAGCAR